MTSKPRMRTIPQAYAELKAADPDTCFTEYALRQLVLSGQIPTVRAGRKFLINLDLLFEYLGCREENIE